MPNTTKTINKIVLNGTQKLVFFFNDRYMTLSSTVFVTDKDANTKDLRVGNETINLMDSTPDKHEIILDKDSGKNILAIVGEMLNEFDEKDLIQALVENNIEPFIEWVRTDS